MLSHFFRNTSQLLNRKCRIKQTQKSKNSIHNAEIVIIILLGRIAVLRTYIWGLVLQTEYRGLFVCRSVYLSRSCALQNGWTDRDFVLVVDSGGRPREPRWSPDPVCEGTIFWEKRATHCKVQGLSAVSCAKTAEPIELPFVRMDSGGSNEACFR